MKETRVESFRREYLDTLPTEDPARSKPCEAGAFGDTKELADEIGALISSGTKTATCSALWEYEAEDEPLPRVGEKFIVLDGDGEPLCIIETTKVEVRPYDKVDEEFAFLEGEGDRSLEYWREAHWEFFTRSLPGIGREPSVDMPLVCERFRVVYGQNSEDDTLPDSNNFQRVGSASNSYVGYDFERVAREILVQQDLCLEKDFGLAVGVGEKKKVHRFDLGSASPKVVVECKSHRWTAGGNVPSAKMTVWNEAMYYFALVPDDYRKIFFVLRDYNSKKKETLAEYYLRTCDHLVPNGVEVWEYDEPSAEAVVWKQEP